MIRIQINPARVETVTFESKSTLEEDFDLVAWQLIRSLVSSIDRKLRREAKTFVRQSGSQGGRP